jgi:hypothetical protein
MMAAAHTSMLDTLDKCMRAPHAFDFNSHADSKIAIYNGCQIRNWIRKTNGVRTRTARAQGIQKQKKNKVEDDKIDKQQQES